jgi:outer membrane protein assembly factor BamD
MKKSNLYILAFIILLAFGLSSCDPYQKLLKSGDLNLKLTKAKEFYNKEDYQKAQPLFEEVLATLRGTKNFEQVYYYYAWSHFGSQDYVMAAYHFKYISDNFPNYDNATECEYMSAYCYYLLSPEMNLDQTETTKGINGLQLFINNHPEDPRVQKANEYITKLREKLELKATNAADLYYNTSSYKASLVAYKGVLKDFPDTKNADYLHFQLIKASYDFGKQSINAKKTERLTETINYYSNFIDKFASSKYSKEAQKIYDNARAELEKLKNTKQ